MTSRLLLKRGVSIATTSSLMDTVQIFNSSSDLRLFTRVRSHLDSTSEDVCHESQQLFAAVTTKLAHQPVATLGEKLPPEVDDKEVVPLADVMRFVDNVKQLGLIGETERMVIKAENDTEDDLFFVDKLIERIDIPNNMGTTTGLVRPSLTAKTTFSALLKFLSLRGVDSLGDESLLVLFRFLEHLMVAENIGARKMNLAALLTSFSWCTRLLSKVEERAKVSGATEAHEQMLAITLRVVRTHQVPAMKFISTLKVNADAKSAEAASKGTVALPAMTQLVRLATALGRIALSSRATSVDMEMVLKVFAFLVEAPIKIGSLLGNNKTFKGSKHQTWLPDRAALNQVVKLKHVAASIATATPHTISTSKQEASEASVVGFSVEMQNMAQRLKGKVSDLLKKETDFAVKVLREEAFIVGNWRNTRYCLEDTVILFHAFATETKLNDANMKVAQEFFRRIGTLRFAEKIENEPVKAATKKDSKKDSKQEAEKTVEKKDDENVEKKVDTAEKSNKKKVKTVKKEELCVSALPPQMFAHYCLAGIACKAYHLIDVPPSRMNEREKNTHMKFKHIAEKQLATFNDLTKPSRSTLAATGSAANAQASKQEPVKQGDYDVKHKLNRKSAVLSSPRHSSFGAYRLAIMTYAPDRMEYKERKRICKLVVSEIRHASYMKAEFPSLDSPQHHPSVGQLSHQNSSEYLQTRRGLLAHLIASNRLMVFSMLQEAIDEALKERTLPADVAANINLICRDPFLWPPLKGLSKIVGPEKASRHLDRLMGKLAATNAFSTSNRCFMYALEAAPAAPRDANLQAPVQKGIRCALHLGVKTNKAFDGIFKSLKHHAIKSENLPKWATLDSAALRNVYVPLLMKMAKEAKQLNPEGWETFNKSLALVVDAFASNSTTADEKESSASAAVRALEFQQSFLASFPELMFIIVKAAATLPAPKRLGTLRSYEAHVASLSGLLVRALASSSTNSKQCEVVTSIKPSAGSQSSDGIVTAKISDIALLPRKTQADLLIEVTAIMRQGRANQARRENDPKMKETLATNHLLEEELRLREALRLSVAGAIAPFVRGVKASADLHLPKRSKKEINPREMLKSMEIALKGL